MRASGSAPKTSSEKQQPSTRSQPDYLEFISLLEFSLFAIIILLSGCRKPGPPYGVTEALKSFKVESGFHVEKFVSEPDIASPVAMDVD